MKITSKMIAAAEKAKACPKALDYLRSEGATVGGLSTDWLTWIVEHLPEPYRSEAKRMLEK